MTDFGGVSLLLLLITGRSSKLSCVRDICDNSPTVSLYSGVFCPHTVQTYESFPTTESILLPNCLACFCCEKARAAQAKQGSCSHVSCSMEFLNS
jgi:hypothetical protein